MAKILLPTLLFLAFVASVAGGIVWQWQQQSGVAGPTTSLAEFAEQLAQTREVLTPPPLRRQFAGPAGQLTAAGVVSATNSHRALNNLPALTTNQALTQAAQNKLDDLFAQQYFDHVSPDGVGPADLVDNVGYQYIRVGENLALGTFANDADLVQAWMDSPGHRANILKDNFSAIGVAVAPGTFEDQETWIGVQTFALPLSSCPLPDPELEQQLNTDKATLDQIALEIETEATELETARTALETTADEVTDLASQGNAKINQGNSKIEEGNQVFQNTKDRDQAQPLWDEGAALQATGTALLDQADTKQTTYQQQTTTYKAKRRSYNDKVNEQNKLSDSVKNLVSLLNEQIIAFNACAG